MDKTDKNDPFFTIFKIKSGNKSDVLSRGSLETDSPLWEGPKVAKFSTMFLHFL